jgi:hypothetical protein
MTSAQLGALKRLDPRDVWKNEAQDFTPWLAENLDFLSEALPIDGIDLEQIEMAVGDFKVDIVGRESGSPGRRVIIENQLDKTDHGHLGQLLTYAAGLNAEIVIWVSPEFRDESRQALEWLNDRTGDGVSFFGVELELLQIGESAKAANFRVVVEPSEFKRDIVTSTVHSQRQLAYHEFFQDLLVRLKGKSPGFTKRDRAPYDSWIGFGSGKADIGLHAAFTSANQFRIELYIDLGNHEANKAAFDQLYGQRAQVEDAVGDPLTWDRLDHRRACRVFAHKEGSIDSPPELLETFKDWGVDQLVNFKQVFAPYLQSLDVQASPTEATP